MNVAQFGESEPQVRWFQQLSWSPFGVTRRSRDTVARSPAVARPIESEDVRRSSTLVSRDASGWHIHGHITTMSLSTYTANARYVEMPDEPDLLEARAFERLAGDRFLVSGRLGAGGLTVELIDDDGGRIIRPVVVPGDFSEVLEVPRAGDYRVAIRSNVDGFTSLEERVFLDRMEWFGSGAAPQ